MFHCHSAIASGSLTLGALLTRCVASKLASSAIIIFSVLQCEKKITFLPHVDATEIFSFMNSLPHVKSVELPCIIFRWSVGLCHAQTDLVDVQIVKNPVNV